MTALNRKDGFESLFKMPKMFRTEMVTKALKPILRTGFNVLVNLLVRNSNSF